jgi:hypothetical protein
MSTHDTTAVASRVPMPEDVNDVDRIKAGIERTQADLVATVNELQRRLTVSHVMGEARESARATLRTWARTALVTGAIAYTRLEDAAREARRQARRHPAPIALLGAGAAAAVWLGARRRRS